MEVGDSCFEEGLMFVAGNVLGDVLASALGVPHFAEDASAGTGDSFDGEGALVGVEWFAESRFSFCSQY